jgi:rod shape-determining protein MreC
MEIMIGRKAAFTTFIIVLVISILLLILASFGFLNGFTGFLSRITFPVQKSLYSAFGLLAQKNGKDRISELEFQNFTLNKKVIDQSKLQSDMQALKDQFAVSNPQSINLLAANILGFPSFIPNVSVPETLVIDKGLDDGLKAGQAVVYKDNLVGKIYKVTANKSLVYLITHPDFTFTAKILNSKTEGVITGLGGGEMILDGVLLSDTLKTSDTVLTKGDLTIDNTGFPSGLIIGKITVINKNPSALFQVAGVKSLVDFSKLSTVFVYVGSKQ